MTRCGIITLLVCVSLPSIFTQTTTLTVETNKENTTTKPVLEFPRTLQPFSQLAHGLRSGPITIIDNRTFFITDLYYDGKGPDAHFWVGNGSAPSITGILVPDENGSNKSLSAYTGQNVTIRLPNDLTVDQIDYLGLWCIEFSQNFGHVLIREERKTLDSVPTARRQEPLGIQLEPFKQLAHGLRSGPIIIVDKKTFYIPNLHYDGKGPDAHFWVGKGSQPSPTGLLVPDEKGSSKSISGYFGQNIYITLPDGITVDDIEYLGVWCIEYKHNFGHVVIPKNIKVPEPKGNPLFTEDNKMIFRIQKCCPLDQVLRPSGCGIENQGFDPQIDVHVHNNTHVDDEPLAAQSIRFAPYVNHINCEHNQYPLIPGEDRFAFLQNGSLMVLNTQQILSLDNYCMETVDIGDEQQSDWVTTAIVCFSSADVHMSSTLFVIYAVGVLVSAVFLIVTALVFILVKEVRDARGKCVIGYALSMAAAFISLASAQLSGIDDENCNTIGFVIQFFLVSSFTWLTMVSWETYTKIKKHSSEAYTKDRKRLIVYISIGVLVPILTLIISLAVDKIPGIPNTILKPHFGKNSCWFDQKEGTMLYFYVPIGIAIFFNILLAALMKWNLVWFDRNKKGDISWNAIKMDLKPMFRSCTFLLSVMTLCWIMEIISYAAKSEGGFWTAIDIINSLQGLIIFIIFVLHRPVKDKICQMRLRSKRINYRKEEEKPMKVLNANGSSTNTNHNNHNDFLTQLQRVESAEDLT